MLFLSSDTTLHLSEDIAEDDVDRLFKKLHKLEPPVDTVKQILARVRQLPGAWRYERGPSQPGAHVPPVPEKQQEASDSAQ